MEQFWLSFSMPVVKSVSLSDDEVFKMLDDSVPKAHIFPKTLFKVKEGSNGNTSEWGTCCKFQHVLSVFLAATDGRQLTMKPFCKQLATWLKKEGYTWSVGDIEESAAGFRVMIRSLKMLKDLWLCKISRIWNRLGLDNETCKS